MSCIRIASFLLLLISLSSSQGQTLDSVWATITPSPELAWTSCYDTFQCARLEVPLDWTRPSNNVTMAIAVIRLSSTLPPSDVRYRGPMVYNPGGFGHSGTAAVLKLGSAHQKMMGEEYDILGFDPRGFARTTPPLRPFLSREEDSTFAIKTEAIPPLGLTPDAIARTYAHYQAFGTVQQSRMGDVAPYVSTPQVARDMLAIIKAAGYPKLKYWGVSYGTVLGATFATMFPDSVERLILDGVLDASDWYSARWRRNLFTTDKGLAMYAEACSKAGPVKCALHAASGEGVLLRIHKIFESLKVAPVSVAVGNGTTDYGFVDYAMVKRTVQTFLVLPHSIPSQNLARMLAGLENGDASFFWKSRFDARNFVQCSSDSSLPPDPTGAGMYGLGALGCGDAEPVKDAVPELQEWYEANAKESPFADVWNFRVVCAGWKIRPAEAFTGPVGANTSFPILFVGNTADPTSPLANAKKASKLFPGSSVLAINTAGHTSLATTSMCASRVMRTYFRDGVLPEVGTTCQSDIKFFEDAASKPQMTLRSDFEEAVHYIAQNARIPNLARP